jgi:catechol 2,3-dioxygenase-like lactoylglutathione lyase family enzyme
MTHTKKETTMPGPLSNAHTVTKLPAQDLERARAFYRDKLGLEPVEERIGGLRYVCGPTEFHLFSIAAPDNCPSKGTGELGTFFYDSEGATRG